MHSRRAVSGRDGAFDLPLSPSCRRRRHVREGLVEDLPDVGQPAHLLERRRSGRPEHLVDLGAARSVASGFLSTL